MSDLVVMGWLESAKVNLKREAELAGYNGYQASEIFEVQWTDLAYDVFSNQAEYSPIILDVEINIIDVKYFEEVFESIDEVKETMFYKCGLISVVER